MARADNSAFLAQANARRRQAALSAARHAIEQLQRQGQAVNFSTVAQSAGVSRGWLYRQDQIRDLISRQQELKPPASRRVATQRATADCSASDSMPPAPRSPAYGPRTAPSATSSPATSASSGPNTTAPQANHHDTRDNATQGCGGDMSTPQKHLPTRHYLQTTSDNRRSGRLADVVGGCVCDADWDVLCGAALIIGQSQGSLARLGTRV
jgi:hypothetical protein